MASYVLAGICAGLVAAAISLSAGHSYLLVLFSYWIGGTCGLIASALSICLPSFIEVGKEM